MDYLPLVLVLAAFVLHVLGERRAVVLTGRPRDRTARQRALMFYAALAVIVVALESPIDSLSDQLFWVHMIQHLLLLVAAAPLIVLARPWMSIWRPLPLSLRRALARTAVRSRWFAPLRALAHLVTQPVAAWVIFNVNLVLWHMPGPYDATLESTSVHVLEHTTFLVLGILFWAQVAAYPPARTHLSYGQRIAYLAAAAIPNIGLSMFLAYAQHPLYSHYAALAHRPGGISALTDQQIGAGFMWTAGDLPFAIAIGLLAHRWLDSHAARPARVGTPLP
ncbi:MAG: cytochrome c oxidase assembly protein [Solirubrobacterales bacterium]|nr:cytochrome c oxidase assembly protein [Solirubrobacterales bacterium]